MSDVFEKVRRLAKAGANVLHIASYEWERVQGIALGLARELKLDLHVWSASKGLETLHMEDGLQPEDPQAADPLDVLRTIHGEERPGVWLFEDAHPYLKAEHHQVLRWIREICRARGPRKLVLLSTTLPDLPSDLAKEVPTVEVPLPDVEALETVCKDVATALDVPMHHDVEPLIQAARGLTVMEAKLAFGQAAVVHGRLGVDGVETVAKEKERIIQRSRVLECYDTAEQWGDVGGLDRLKEWLERRGRAFGQGAREYGLEPPKGALLLGVQGCGKSLVAKAIAARWRFPLLRFDVGKVYAGIVGESEANIRTALQVAQALAPCVLWIDEIEKGLSGVESSDRTDSGTAARVLGTLLTWMQEKREPVFVVATANRVEMLPPELLRKGRFDEIFFVDLPTASVRAEIFHIHLRKKKRDPSQFAIPLLVSMSAGYSGAEIEEAVREALFDAFSEGLELKTEHIQRALESTYPLSRTMREPIEELRKWAKVRARAASAEEPESIPPDKEAVPRLRQEQVRNPFVPKREARDA